MVRPAPQVTQIPALLASGYGQCNPVEPVRHNMYYFEDGVVFRADDTLFKIPRYMLNIDKEIPAESPLFNKGRKGVSDENPIILADVSADEFLLLLKLLYPKTVFGSVSLVTSWSESEWLSVFELATKWNMQSILKAIKEHLYACASPVTKILIGQAAGFPDWLRRGLIELCLRQEPLTLTEATQLGVEDAVKIALAREKIRSIANVPKSVKYHESKYGGCYIHESEPRSLMPYSQHRMIHHILDETFNLKAYDNGDLHIGNPDQ
ncbi:hypothetical protein BU17DRAFT_85332 [Hysterangium stoloniferum]|nr:hypothetical protein BU17DRAFT_85332 [Hysterangium stoloniferum]